MLQIIKNWNLSTEDKIVMAINFVLLGGFFIGVACLPAMLGV